MFWLVEDLLQDAVQSTIVKMGVFLALKDYMDLVGLRVSYNAIDVVLYLIGIVKDLLIDTDDRNI